MQELLNKYEEAIISFESALAVNPKHKEALNNLGVIYQEKNEIDAAIEYFKDALKMYEVMIEAYEENFTTMEKENDKWKTLHQYVVTQKISDISDKQYADMFI